MNRIKEFEDLTNEINDEAKKHRWIESEKAGYDLGPKAERQWFDLYFSQWKEQQKQKIFKQLNIN